MAALSVCSRAAAAAVATSAFRLASSSPSLLPSPNSACCTTTSFTPRGLPAPGGLSLRHLEWVGQRSKKRIRAVKSSFVVAAAATAVEEPATASAVTTEAVPRPTKVGKGVVRLRLTRLGRKKRPFYRIVATHHSWRRDGKYIELLGHYNPLHAKDDLGIVVKADRIKYWLGVGAQPSDTVAGILHKVGILKKTEPEQ